MTIENNVAKAAFDTPFSSCVVLSQLEEFSSSLAV